MKLGVMFPFDEIFEERLSELRSWKIPTCQIVFRKEGMCTPASAELVRRLAPQYGVDITAIWSLQRGPKVWDFHTGPLTIGLVPRAYRWDRMTQVLEAAAFAASIGVKHIALHAGFIPEHPSDGNYPEVVAALAFLAARLADAGQSLLLETGQDTPVTLRRTIHDVGATNVGVNFDPANFLMYGTANPLDALDLLGPHVLGVHAKDGEYPVDGKALGVEKPLGKGRVDFPRLIEKLKIAGYDGPLTIEREIEGPEQKRDIVAAARLLEKLL